MTSLKEDAQVYMILSSLEIEIKVSMCDLTIVREFSLIKFLASLLGTCVKVFGQFFGIFCGL